jgi:membrane associated rhomboid family serine protease
LGAGCRRPFNKAGVVFDQANEFIALIALIACGKIFIQQKMALQNQTDDGHTEHEEYGPPGGVKFPVPVYTYILLACIVAVTAAQFLGGLDESILAAGFVKTAFLQKHEYWRIVTGAALHGGRLHIFFNGYALYSFGRIFELLSNKAHLATVFLLSAIGGGLLSLYFIPNGISVGASGGIVGMIGYLAVYAFKRRQFIAPEFRRSLLINIGFILVFGLLLWNTIDNFGHIGGLITGAVYAFLQVPSDEYVDPRAAGSLAKIFGIVSLGIFIAASVFSIMLIFRIV